MHFVTILYHKLNLCLFPAGEYSYLGSTLRQVDIEPMPSLTDVRQLIALYGILPLGKFTAEIAGGKNTMLGFLSASYIFTSYDNA